MTTLDRQSAGALADAVRRGQTTAAAIMANTLERIAAYDLVQPQIWISRRTSDDLYRLAASVDRRLAAGENLPLAGVPFAAKDNIDVAGTRTTAACPAFAYQPERSATVVELLEAAGAICVGKTNLDQFATGLVGTRSPYGVPRNAYNHAYISGGSSSGSAVAVAAGLVPFALGTDTAGSGRVPAAFQHLVGFKPSKGRWSTRGLVPACRTLDCITVFTDELADAALIDGVLGEFDAEDPFSKGRADRPLTARRIAVPPKKQRVFFGDAEAEYFYDRALDGLSKHSEIVEIDISFLLEAASLLYGGPWVAERTAAVFDLIVHDPAALDDTVREVIAPGLQISAVELWKGQYRLAELQRQAEAMWKDVDALAFPTTGTTYRVSELAAASIALNSNLGLYTNFVNLLDMAAVAVPAGVRRNGTGFGVTFIGPTDTDRALIDLASRYREGADRTCPPDLDMEGKLETVQVAVVGAHLKDMPLHWQLTSRNARFVGAAQTAPNYRLYAIANSVPPKPALVFSETGASIALEIYELDIADFGSFVVEVPAPLAIGSVTLEDGSTVKGFVAEPRAIEGAAEITQFGGWRAYVASL